MAKTITCPDGTVIRGSSDDELIAGLEAYFIEAHPELVGLLSRDEILSRAIAEPLTEKTDRHGQSVPNRKAQGGRR
jgi:hypothetical protein